MPLWLLFEPLAQTGLCRGVSLILDRERTRLGQYQGFGHATAPGFTVGFLRTCAVGATNEPMRERWQFILGRGSNRAGRAMARQRTMRLILDCCTTGGVQGILPE
ncbi:hypothetical protein D3C87_1589440 [compost metagenome]